MQLLSCFCKAPAPAPNKSSLGPPSPLLSTSAPLVQLRAYSLLCFSCSLRLPFASLWRTQPRRRARAIGEPVVYLLSSASAADEPGKLAHPGHGGPRAGVPEQQRLQELHRGRRQGEAPLREHRLELAAADALEPFVSWGGARYDGPAQLVEGG